MTRTIHDRVNDLEREFKGLSNTKTDQQRNKRAIELHSKLDQLVTEIDDHDDYPGVQQDKDRLKAMIESLLRNVFRISV